MRINRFLKILLFVLIFNPSNVFAELNLPPKTEQLFYNGIKSLFNDEIDVALNKFDSLCVIDPENPIGYFCKAFCYGFIMDEYRNLNFMDKFNEAADNAIKKSKILEEKENPTSEIFLWSGASLGIKAIRDAMMGNWWDAIWDGLKAGDKLERCLKIDSTLYDVYFGLGNYHYWKSVKSKVFWWLPFVGDERQKGINEIKISIEKGKFAEIPGKISLMRIYIEEKNYNELIKLADELLKEYNFLYPLWYKAFSNVQIGEWQKAIILYNEILKKLNKKYFHGIEGEIECYYFIALCNYKIGKIEEAKKHLNKILPYKGKIETKIYFYENFMDSSEKLMKEIEKSN